jgi:hypothetical protein
VHELQDVPQTHLVLGCRSTVVHDIVGSLTTFINDGSIIIRLGKKADDGMEMLGQSIHMHSHI